jgi:hypothetical protein
VIPSQTAEGFIQHAFVPTQGGIVALTDQLLEACVGSDVEFKRIGKQCVCNWAANGETKQALVPLPPAAFRTILARIAALCNEFSPNAVSPYREEGLLTVKRVSPAVVRVAFVNTPDEQRLEVRGNAESSDSPVLHGGPDAALRAAIEPLATFISASSNPREVLTHAMELLLVELGSDDQATGEAIEKLRHIGLHCGLTCQASLRARRTRIAAPSVPRYRIRLAFLTHLHRGGSDLKKWWARQMHRPLRCMFGARSVHYTEVDRRCAGCRYMVVH